jgi:hypothetical protein
VIGNAIRDICPDSGFDYGAFVKRRKRGGTIQSPIR